MNEDCAVTLEAVIRCALFADWSARTFGADPDDTPLVGEAYKSLALAVRDAANVIDDQPPRERPEGWNTSPDGATA